LTGVVTYRYLPFLHYDWNHPIPFDYRYSTVAFYGVGIVILIVVTILPLIYRAIC